MGLIDRYRKFAELSDEEVRAQFRQQADETRARELERVEMIDLSSTTPEELPHPAIAAAISFAAKRALNHSSQAETEQLRSRLAKLSGFDPRRVAVGQGATGVISSIAAATLGPGKTLLTPWPSYPLYPAAAAAAGAEAEPIASWAGPAAAAAAVAEHPSACILVLCNPNDPDGRLIPAAQIAELRDLLPDSVTLIVDEALADYAGEQHMIEMSDLADSTAGIILIRSLSKAWGLSGLRVGWALGGPGS
jgi:histidinol-phosphate aminotransferase